MNKEEFVSYGLDLYDKEHVDLLSLCLSRLYDKHISIIFPIISRYYDDDLEEVFVDYCDMFVVAFVQYIYLIKDVWKNNILTFSKDDVDLIDALVIDILSVVFGTYVSLLFEKKD